MGTVRVRLFGEQAEQVAAFEKMAAGPDTMFLGAFVRDYWATLGTDFPENWPENWRVMPLEQPSARPHLRGTLAMLNLPLENGAPLRFQIILGKPKTEAELDKFGQKLPPDIRKKYLAYGGEPAWDERSTVFGEIVEGMDVLDRIAAMPTDGEHRPLRAVPVRVVIDD
jgi:cyclophilin family peptidyl-prolyl cis-trans isomerase